MGYFENIREAMGTANDSTTSGLESPSNGSHSTDVQEVVKAFQECLQWKTEKQNDPSAAQSPNLIRMQQWCDSLSNKWFAQYYYHNWLSSAEYHAINEVNRYLQPTIIYVSLTTTLLAFFVLWRIDSKQKRAAWYFIFTINNCILLKVLLDTLPRYTAMRFGTVDLYQTVVGCKLLTFFMNVLQYAPGWILAVAFIDQVTASRRARTEQAHGAERGTRPSTLSYFAAKATVICILVGLGVINVHTLWLYNTRIDSAEGDGSGGGGGGGSGGGGGGSSGYTGTAGTNATAPPPEESPRERRGRCQMTPSDEPRIFTLGYPLFLFTMHTVLPLLILLGTFLVHLITLCSNCRAPSNNASETRLVALCAALFVLCDLPAAGVWFYFQLGLSPRTYQNFKINYSINFSIKSWNFLKYVFFVPMLLCASPECRGGAIYLTRYLLTALARRGSCRRSREASSSCSGRGFQCICECTAPTCEAQPTDLCDHRCFCLRCRWPVLDSIEYTRGYTISQPKRGPPVVAKASIEADDDSTDLEATSSPRMSSYKTDAVLTRLALPVLCDCACLYQDPWRHSPSFAEHDEEDFQVKTKAGEERQRTNQPASLRDTEVHPV